MLQQDSPFLNPGATTKANQLAIIQLARDDLVPVYLRDSQGEHDGYKEGHVLNTRFGSFPHSTLIGIPWGSQVRASIVDTGSRGRKKKNNQKQPLKGNTSSKETTKKTDSTIEQAGVEQDSQGTLKRKRDAQDEGEKRIKSEREEAAQSALETRNTATEQTQYAEPINSTGPQNDNDDDDDDDEPEVALQNEQGETNRNSSNTQAAASGFVHVLQPTPEIWTSSLPHRTQVVYTPDYSYVLQRIRARPGSRLIEAGSGSGSFTHAAARAVYDGCTEHQPNNKMRSTGKVFSFEFHEQRFEKMKGEIREHGLSRLVEINHRDVYNEGFLVDGKSPEADAVFLDLPAPWLALPHLSRRKPKTGTEMEGVQGGEDEAKEWISPLNPRKSVYICTFSPCIEQVTRTVSEMRKLGWVEIEMVEIAHKRIQVFREKIGLNVVSERGAQQAPKDVAEALIKLKEVEGKAATHNAKLHAKYSVKKKGKGGKGDDDDLEDDDDEENVQNAGSETNGAGIAVEEAAKENNVKPFMQGNIITRPEAEIKAHTSYLVFAILPREWTDEDEAAAAAKWPVGEEQKVIGHLGREARKQAKREMMQGNRKKNHNAWLDKKAAKAAEKKAAEISKDADVTVEEAKTG